MLFFFSVDMKTTHMHNSLVFFLLDTWMGTETERKIFENPSRGWGVCETANSRDGRKSCYGNKTNSWGGRGEYWKIMSKETFQPKCKIIRKSVRKRDLWYLMRNMMHLVFKWICIDLRNNLYGQSTRSVMSRTQQSC